VGALHRLEIGGQDNFEHLTEYSDNLYPELRFLHAGAVGRKTGFLNPREIIQGRQVEAKLGSLREQIYEPTSRRP
jgi:hypothetical protein